jgi:hypothetical protein
MADSSSRTTITAAVIGVIGSVLVALIANWDKFTGAPNAITTPPIQSSAPAQPVPTVPPKDDVPSVTNIAGTWRDVNYPTNGSRIVQEGNSFQFNGWGVLPQGIGFESVGAGTITGQSVTTTYTARYQDGSTSSGSCSGTVSGDGSRMTSTCTDSELGTFVSSGQRQ